MPASAERKADPRRYARLGAIAAVYLAACGVMLSPICNFRHLATAVYPGDARLIVWTLAWDNHALLARVPSFFDANIFYPVHEALAYSEHLIGISLFTLPIYALTHNPVLAYNLVWILSYLLAAGAAHYLVWRHTRDHLAATVSGLAYAFCFFRMHHGHGHLHLLWVFWVPLSLVAMERWLAVQSWNRLWIFVAIVSLQALASWYQAVMIFVTDALFMVWLVVVEPAIARRREWTPARLARVTVQSVVGGIVALAVIWPFARHYHVLTSGGPIEVAPGSADLGAYLMPPENTLLGQWLLARGVKGPRWIWGELTLYLGWLTLMLAAIGAAATIVSRDENVKRLRFFILLAIAAVLLSVGPNAAEVTANNWGWSAFGLVARIPGADLFRVPARFASLLTLALAVLAGAACAALHVRFGRNGRALTLAMIPLMLAEFYVVSFPGGPPAPAPVPSVYKFIAALPPGVVASLPDFAGTTLWFQEPDYQYYSTAHWHPIANGYSRAEPSGFADRMRRMNAFPDAVAVSTMRETGVRYVVVHAAQFPAGGVARSQESGGFHLLARFGTDYLFVIDD